MPNKLPSIYGLCAPGTEVVRYVGKANDPIKRRRIHLNDRSDRRLGRWIRSLKPQVPSLVILESACSDWQASERKWIAKLRGEGRDLLNHTDGGDGISNPTDETREKLRQLRRAEWADPIKKERWLQILRSPQRRQKISEALTGLKKTADHVAKLPQNRPGKIISEAHKEKVRAALRKYGWRWPKGVSRTSETKMKISEALRGNQHTKGRVMPMEERRRRSETQKGKAKSMEWKLAISAGQRRRWALRKEMGR